MSELKEMRTMTNEKHGIAKILEEIIEYAETLGFWHMVSCQILLEGFNDPLTVRAHHHCETPARTGDISRTIHMQILYHLSIQLNILAG